MTVARVGSLDESITVTVEGLPTGVQATTATLGVGDDNATLTLTADGSATPGTSTLTVKATAGDVTHEATVTLVISAPAAQLIDVVPLDATGTTALDYRQFRQGLAGLKLRVSGKDIGAPAAADVKLGDLTAKTVTPNADGLIADFDLPHGGVVGSKDLRITYPNGTATWPGAIVITNIIVATSGDDVTGRGTTESPLRTLTKGVSFAAKGDVVRVGEGEYSTGEGFPLTVPASVTIDGAHGGNSEHRTSIVLQAETSKAFVLSPGSTLSTLAIKGGIAAEVKTGKNVTTSIVNVLAHDAGDVGFDVSGDGDFTFECSSNALPCGANQKKSGVRIGGTASAKLFALECSNNAQYGLYVYDKANVVAMGGSFSSNGNEMTSQYASIAANGTSTLTLGNLTIAGPKPFGVLQMAGSTVKAQKIVVQGSSEQDSAYFGTTLSSGTLEVEDCTAKISASMGGAKHTRLLRAYGGKSIIFRGGSYSADYATDAIFLQEGFADGSSTVRFEGVSISNWQQAGIRIGSAWKGTLEVVDGAAPSQFTKVGPMGSSTIGIFTDERASGTDFHVSSKTSFDGTLLPAGTYTKTSTQTSAANRRIFVFSGTTQAVFE